MKEIAFKFLVILITIGFISCNQEGVEINDSKESETQKRDVPGLMAKRGLITHTDQAAPGYIIYNPNSSGLTYLMNREGQIVHEWKGYFHTWLSYLMDDGRVVRNVVDPDAPVFYAGGMTGRMDEVNWMGEVTWQFEYATEDYQIHHDIEVLPNGNILSLCWDHRTREELINLGRNPDYIPLDGLWFDKIIELNPTKPSGGKIIWEWRFWDHLIQDTDPSLPNYGNLADHPELMDINVNGVVPPEPIHIDSLLQLKKEGKVHRNRTVSSEGGDIFHTNSINYNADLDQIVFSAKHIGEIFIIDHSTTTEEAVGHKGGKYGKGGDFLYRWGNPGNYHRGDSTDQQIFHQHDVRWIRNGYPGQGNLTLYNNRVPRSDGMEYSAVHELKLPLQLDGQYSILEDGTYGPKEPFWTYMANDTLSLYSPFCSGAMRLKNGNTFILQGAAGRMIEVSANGEIVWEYWTPFHGDVRLPNGNVDMSDGQFYFWLFRSTFIPADHPALVGKELKPLDPQPNVFKLPPSTTN